MENEILKFSQDEELKYCEGCDKVKSLYKDFYRGGKNSFQKYCKPCHIENRKKYKKSNSYKKRPTGFKKLQDETRKNILNDIRVRINYKKIALKYNLNYLTLLRWKREGQLKL